MKNSVLLVTATALLFLTACAQVGPLPTRAPIQATEPGNQTTITSTPVIVPSPTIENPVFPTLQFTSSPPATCKPEPVIPVREDNASSFPPVTENDWSYGVKEAPITITTYCSYQRVACKNLMLNLANLQDEYTDVIQIVYRHFPQVEVDDKSLLASQAAEAAGLQNRFWEMNNLLYTQQDEWVKMTLEDFSLWLLDEIPALGISTSNFESDLRGETVLGIVNQSIEDARLLEIENTPVLYFNDVLVKTGVDMESLEVLIQYFKLPEKAYQACPEMTIDPLKKYTATFSTEKGDIKFELYPEKAPWAVNSFVFLAREGWYDNTAFYRVVPGFVIQGGDPSNSGLGSPGFSYGTEVDPSLRFAEEGMLAMMYAKPDTNGSQFFITYIPLPELDGQYTIFGKVIEGMSVLRTLRPRNPGSDQILLPADILLSVTIAEE